LSIDVYPPGGALSSALAYVEVAANQTGITTTEVDLTSLSVTVTVPGGRRLLITGHALFASTAGTPTAAVVRAKEGTTTLNEGGVNPAVNGSNAHVEAVVLPSAGTHTYKLAAITDTGTVSLIASSARPSFILVEDITGTVWPQGQSVTAGMIASEAWAIWVPTWTNLTVGNGTTLATFSKQGREVNFRLRFVLGTTSAVGTTPTFTLPIPAASDYVQEWPIGPATYVDTGVKAYDARCQINNTTTALLRHDDGLGSYASTTATAPFTWGNLDHLMVTGCYEAAT